VLDDLPLDPAIHDRQGFDCGVPALNEYIHRFAEQHRRRGISSVYVLTDPARPELILGYYTLSAAEVDGQRLTEAERKKLPRYPVPCFRMGRLACRSDQQGRGLGKLLVGCAVDRCLQARQQVAAYALVVDAKDDSATAFYLHFGFRPFVDAKRTLYLPFGQA
jgi:GNAT superfamily N-acetyltransferase